MYLLLLWALVALIGRVHCKCSLAPIVDDERSIAYACIHGDLNDLGEISSEAEWIEFSVSRIHYIPDNAFSRFQNLRRLSFYNCHVNFISPDAFAGLSRLEWLIFHGTKIHVVQAAWFRHLPNLKRLIFDRCGLVHIEPNTFRMLPRLQTLGLRDNDLDCLSTEELSYLRMLRAVRVDGNPWLCECRQRMERFFRDRSIAEEDEYVREGMYRNLQCMTQIGMSILPLSLNVQQMNIYERERMAIRGNEFETSVFNSLDRLPDKTTWIEISGLRIEKLPKYAFFRFGNSLRSLDLNDCSITVIENGAFAGLHRLERLSLIGNKFSTVAADWFRDLLALQQLVLLENVIEQIERTALWHLGDSLRHLDIRNNRLRCLAVEELQELKKLERLDATGNPWTCECRRNLQSFLTSRNIGFEISAGRCYENENDIPEPTDSWRQQQVITQNTSTTGKVHWTSFEQSIKHQNITIVRPPPPPTPTAEIIIQSTQSPIYKGTCYPEKTEPRSRPIYTCSGISSIEELNVIPRTVHTIRVILSNIQKIPAKTFTRFNGYLSRLELRDCGIEQIEYGAFTDLYNLEYLSLHNNQLDSVTSDTVHGLSNLRHLDLSHNHIYRITNDVFDTLPYLTSLDISENSMNCIGVEHMSHRLSYLSTLKVSNNPWSCLCGTKLAQYLESRRIQYDRNSLIYANKECHTLGVSVTSTTSSPRTTIDATTSLIPTSSEVIETTVTGTCSSYDNVAGIHYRCMGGNLLLLQTIPSNVNSIEFYEGYLPHLPAGSFSRFVDLQELVIRNSGLATVEQGAFDGLDKLKNLTIQDNPLETVGSSWFILRNLQRLDLRGNSIRYIAPGAFRHLNQLTYLNLEGNDLKCIYTSDLNEMPNIYVIEFTGNPLKWRCRVELEQFLEARKIRFIKIEYSCEGKKLMRNLLLENRTDTSFDCPSDCSAVGKLNPFLLMNVIIVPVLSMLIQ